MDMRNPPVAGPIRRSPYLWAALALVVGIVLGLILAWRVWPVRWIDADPSDLRAEHQAAYLQMVADSFAVNGDTQLAGARLYELIESDKDWPVLAAQVAQLATEREAKGDVAGALRLRRLAEMLKLPPPAPAKVKPQPETSKPPEAKPTATSKPAPTEKPTTVLTILALVVAVGAIGGAGVLVWRLWRARRELAPPPEEEEGEPVPEPGPADELLQHAAPTPPCVEDWDTQYDHLPRKAQPEATVAPAQQEKPPEQPPVTYVSLTEAEPELAAGAVQTVVPPTEAQPGEVGPTEKTIESAPAPRAISELLAPTRRPAAFLGEFEAEYKLGDDDFYHAFTIESPEREFLGQCGFVISDVLGVQEAQHVDAFDIWLFETPSNANKAKVLVSPYVFQDEELTAKLSRKGELALAEPGAQLVLEGEQLRLTVTVLSCAFQPWRSAPDAVFSSLSVRMAVEPLK